MGVTVHWSSVSLAVETKQLLWPCLLKEMHRVFDAVFEKRTVYFELGIQNQAEKDRIQRKECYLITDLYGL